jgi:hypothetical protein
MVRRVEAGRLGAVAGGPDNKPGHDGWLVLSGLPSDSYSGFLSELSSSASR